MCNTWRNGYPSTSKYSTDPFTESSVSGASFPMRVPLSVNKYANGPLCVTFRKTSVALAKRLPCVSKQSISFQIMARSREVVASHDRRRLLYWCRIETRICTVLYNEIRGASCVESKKRFNVLVQALSLNKPNQYH